MFRQSKRNSHEVVEPIPDQGNENRSAGKVTVTMDEERLNYHAQVRDEQEGVIAFDARNVSANTVRTYGVQRPSLMQPENASMFRYSFDRPGLYSASEQAMNNVAVRLSGTTG